MTKFEKEVFDEACGVAFLEAKINELYIRLDAVYDAGFNGIEYVGKDNHDNRERHAIDELNRAMFGDYK